MKIKKCMFCASKSKIYDKIFSRISFKIDHFIFSEFSGFIKVNQFNLICQNFAYLENKFKQRSIFDKSNTKASTKTTST